jgi:hypothetical protein
MSAWAWSGAYDVAYRWHQRRSRPHNLFRWKDNPRVLFAQLKSSQPAQPHSSEIHGYVVSMFKQLVSLGLSATEKTFSSMMIAMGQHGDVQGACELLRTVWNIDVHALQQYDEEELESPTFFDEDSPLHPSQRLLQTVIHVFGNNNMMYLASQMNDYISRNYNIPISKETWAQLYELTFQFAKRWKDTEQAKIMTPNQLPAQSLAELFSAMTDKPHNIEPTPNTFFFLARNANQHFSHAPALAFAKQGQHLLDDERTRLSEQLDGLLTIVRGGQTTGSAPWYQDDSFLAQRKAFIEHSIAANAMVSHLQLVVRQLIVAALPSRAEEDYDSAAHYTHTSQNIPNIIRTFPTKLPNQLTYHTISGSVTIENGYVHRSDAISDADAFLQERAGILCHALDVEHLPEMLFRLQSVDKKLNAVTHGKCHMCDGYGHARKDCPQREFVLSGPIELRAPGHQDEDEAHQDEDEEPSTFPETTQSDSPQFTHIFFNGPAAHHQRLADLTLAVHELKQPYTSTPLPTERDPLGAAEERFLQRKAADQQGRTARRNEAARSQSNIAPGGMPARVRLKNMHGLEVFNSSKKYGPKKSESDRVDIWT